MMQKWVFDNEHTTRITEARINFLNQWLPELIMTQGLKRALDVGCGVGYFSRYLADLGLEVIALDARPENITEAQRRHPTINFIVHDMEDPAVNELGLFDIVLCFGFLYHLENPFLTIRNLHDLTKKILLIESMVTPSSFPVASLVDEGYSEDQSLNYVAFIPSESGLIKMLYRAGFSYVYVSEILPDHTDYLETIEFQRKRTVIVAAKIPLKLPFLRLSLEPTIRDPWLKPLGYQLSRFHRFFSKPWREKVKILRSRFRSVWNRLFPFITLPIRLPYSGWWLAANDVCSDAIFTGSFEKPEWRFVEQFLKEGMTVLDIGAHHGFYTILASKKVGPSGRVIAFEPSPRERQRLLLHLKLNRCTNVKVVPFALASDEGERTFFLVEGRDTGCNSLRPPVVSESIKTITVNTVTLDSYLEKENIHHVDFIKMDVEGAELEVFKGAKHFLKQNRRPVILCEVDDQRTQPWGYQSRSIIEFLENCDYQWFGLDRAAKLVSLGKQESYNLVALPQESFSKLHQPIS